MAGWVRDRWPRRRHRSSPSRSLPPGRPQDEATLETGVDEDIIPELVYHDAALALLMTQLTASTALDARASQALTVGSAALPLTIALVSIASPAGSSPVDFALDSLPAMLFVLALACYLAILVGYNRLGTQTQFDFAPEMGSLQKNFAALRTQPLGGRGLKAWVADAYVASTERNARLLGRKARWVSLLQILLALEGTALATGAALSLLL